MTTLKITVDNKKNARLLKQILQNMKFVKKVEEENKTSDDQYQTLNKLFDNIKHGKVFNEIKDPVKWQKDIRHGQHLLRTYDDAHGRWTNSLVRISTLSRGGHQSVLRRKRLP